MDIEIVGDQDLSRRDIHDLLSLVDDQTSCLIVQNPDFLGRIHDLAASPTRFMSTAPCWWSSATRSPLDCCSRRGPTMPMWPWVTASL